MRWEREGYLWLIICLKLKIDESTNPCNEIKAPKWLKKAELKRVIQGWENGSINWIVASDDDIESAKQELELMAKDKVAQSDDHEQRYVDFPSSQLQRLMICSLAGPNTDSVSGMTYVVQLV